jgi:hypothetical protein
MDEIRNGETDMPNDGFKHKGVLQEELNRVKKSHGTD